MMRRSGVVLLAIAVIGSEIRSVAGNVETVCADHASCFDCAEDITAQEYVQFKYRACYDQLNILPEHMQGKCRAFETDNFTFANETLAAGEYNHYHWTLTTYHLINHEAGASITFEVVPEYGYPQMFTKAQILYGGLPMCQMFETKPGEHGVHSDTWPFPDRHTGADAQGPEIEIAELEAANMPTSQTYEYPGEVFSEVTWGFNASGYDSDKRPKVHTVTIPHVSYGGYFVSVYAGDGVPARYSIRVKAERTIDIEEEEVHYADSETPDALTWTQDYCNLLSTEEECTEHCCYWDDGTDEDSRRRMSQVGTPAYKRKLAGEDDAEAAGQCVHASADIICISEKKDDDDTGDDEIPEPSILVSFQTESSTNKKYQLYYVEMNDCASQMDRNGHDYCWQGGWYDDGGRLDEYYAETDGKKFIPASWQATCGKGSGEQDAESNYICDPTYSEPGYCNFNGTGSADGAPAESMWTHAYDCIVWTPNGLSRHGLPVKYVKYLTADDEWSSLEEDFSGNVDDLYGSYNNSLRLKGLVTSYGLEQNTDPTYDGWLTLPPNTWITTEVPIYNNVSYFFNVLKLTQSGDLECYKGTQARTYFWRQTTLIPVEMIEIIAAVVVLALLALLVPFILTKRKITAHLRDVYESHKYKGYLKGVEERVIEERVRREGLKKKTEDSKVDEDEATKKSEAERGDKKHHHHHHKKKKYKAKKTQIVPNSKPRAPTHAKKSEDSKVESKDGAATISGHHSTNL